MRHTSLRKRLAREAARLLYSSETNQLFRARHEALVERLGLPAQAPPGLRDDDLLPIMTRDKKSGGGLTFVLAGPSGIEQVDDPDPAAVRKAFAAVGVEA